MVDNFVTKYGKLYKSVKLIRDTEFVNERTAKNIGMQVITQL
jgi:hypothetical protein